jgi:hypothetical protein
MFLADGGGLRAAGGEVATIGVKIALTQDTFAVEEYDHRGGEA